MYLEAGVLFPPSNVKAAEMYFTSRGFLSSSLLLIVVVQYLLLHLKRRIVVVVVADLIWLV